MNKMAKRILSLILVLVICISLMPVSVYAEGDFVGNESTEEAVDAPSDWNKQGNQLKSEPEEKTVEEFECSEHHENSDDAQGEHLSEEEKKEITEMGDEPDSNKVEEIVLESEEEPFLETAITIIAEKTELFVGDTIQLDVVLTPENTEEKAVVWSSSDNNILSVDDYGLVSAVGMGKATIMVYLIDSNNVFGEIEISVIEDTLEQPLSVSSSDSKSLSTETISMNISYNETIFCGTPTTFIVNLEGINDTSQCIYRLDTIYTGTGSSREMLIDSSRVAWNDATFGYKNDNTFEFTFLASGEYSLRFAAMDKSTSPVTTCNKEISISISDPQYPSISEICKSVAMECNAYCSSDFEKAVWLNDWLIDNASYDNSLWYCNPEGVLIRHIGTCNSYTEAYGMLLNEVGIPNTIAKGNGHIWSVIQLGGMWYQVDTTWNDNNNSSDDTTRHFYFGLTDELMKLAHSDHYAHTGYECNNLENNYFIKSGKVSQWSDPLVEIIQSRLSNGETEFDIYVAQDEYETYETKIKYIIAAYDLSTRITEDRDGNQITVECSYSSKALHVKVNNSNIVARGFCGAETNEGGKESVRWAIDVNGVLTITGRGEMDDYDVVNFSNVPWLQYAANIIKVRIDNNITKVGDYSFFGNTNFEYSSLTVVEIGDDVLSIGENAFANQEKLSSVSIGNGIEALKDGCFEYCIAVKNINLPQSLKEIGENVFRNSGIEEIYIPEAVLKIGNNAFSNSNLQKIYFRGMPEFIGNTPFSGLVLNAFYPCSFNEWSAISNQYGGNISWESYHKYSGHVCTHCGKIEEGYRAISLNAPSSTAVSTITVTGTTIPNATIELLVDYLLTATINSDNNGNFGTTISLPKSDEEQIFIVSSRTHINGISYYDSKEVLFSASRPQIASVKFYKDSDSNPIDLFKLSKSNGLAEINIGTRIEKPYKFEIAINNCDNINSVYLVSKKDNEIKKIEAKYDSQLNSYVTNDYFDPSNINFIPGEISVEYYLENENSPAEYKIGNDINWESIETGIICSNVESTKETDDSLTWDVHFENINNVSDAIIKSTLSVIKFSGEGDEIVASQINDYFSSFKTSRDVFSYLIPNVEGSNCQVLLDASSTEKIIMLVEDISSTAHQIVQYEMTMLEGTGDIAGYTDLFDFADTLSQISSGAKIIGKMYKNHSVCEELRTQALEAYPDNYSKVIDEIDEYETDRNAATIMIQLLKTVGPIAAASFSGPVGLLFSGIIAVVEYEGNLINEKRMMNLEKNSIGIWNGSATKIIEGSAYGISWKNEIFSMYEGENGNNNKLISNYSILHVCGEGELTEGIYLNMLNGWGANETYIEGNISSVSCCFSSRCKAGSDVEIYPHIISFGNSVNHIGRCVICGDVDMVFIEGENIIIDDYAFASNDTGGLTNHEHNIGKIVLPNVIKSIGNYAFLEAHISEVTIPQIVECQNAWFAFSAIEKIVFYNGGIASIPNQAFYEADQLQDIVIPEGTRIIGKKAFSGCDKLKSVLVLDDVEIIGEQAFQNSAIEEIIFSGNIGEIGQRAFEGCSHLSSISFLDVVESIKDFAFIDCNELQSISIPNGLETISENSFAKTQIKSFIVPNTTRVIEKHSFWNSEIEEINIPGTVKTVDLQAFDETNIRELNINEGTENVVLSSFTNLDTLTIPSTVNEIKLDDLEDTIEGGTAHPVSINPGDNMGIPYYCHSKGIGNIKVSSDNKKYNSFNGALYSKELETLLYCPNNITTFNPPINTKRSSVEAFYNAYKLETIFVPQNAVEFYVNGNQSIYYPRTATGVVTYYDNVEIYYEGTEDEWIRNNNGYYISGNPIIHYSTCNHSNSVFNKVERIIVSVEKLDDTKHLVTANEIQYYTCQTCGENWDMQTQTTHLEDHVWKDDFCEICNHECMHTNTNKNEQYYFIEATDCENGTHNEKWIKDVSTICDCCKKVLGFEQEDEYKTENHSWYNGYCIMCNAPNNCDHQGTTTSTEIKLLQELGHDNSDGTCTYKLYDALSNVCSNCGEVFYTDISNPVEYTGKHEWQNGRCWRCGAGNNCEHNNAKREESWYLSELGKDNNDGTHTYIKNSGDYCTCLDCNETWWENTVTSEVTEEHDYVDDKCWICNANDNTEYAIVYRNCENASNLKPSKYVYGDVIILNTPIMDGYTFEGWYADDELVIEAKAPQINSTSRGDKIFYAKWIANTYSVRFNSNGGMGTMPLSKAIFDKEWVIPQNKFTRLGYSFTNWNSKVDSTGTTYANGETVSNLTNANKEVVVLYAQWEANTYKVMFESNGGEGPEGEKTKEQTFTYDETQSLAANPFTRKGYTFTGWKNGSKAYGDKQNVKNLTTTQGATITMVAQWKANTYKINYDKNGNDAIGRMSPQTLTYDKETALTACTFKNPGYSFVGWSKTKELGEEVFTNKQLVKNLQLDGDLTLYAIWKPLVTSVDITINSESVVGQTFAADIYGMSTIQLNSNTEPLDASKDIKWISSSPTVASVDSTGLVTFLKPGSVTVSAISTDGTNKKATVNFNVVYFISANNLKVVPENISGTEVKYINCKGDIIEGDITEGDKNECAVYVNTGAATTFKIKSFFMPSEREPVEIRNKAAVKYTSTNTSVASVVANADGSATVKIAKNATGACTINAITTDSKKQTGGIAVFVQDYKPRIDATSVLLDIQKNNSATFNIVSSYGNTVESIELYEYNAASKKYETPELLKVDSYNSNTGLVTISANKYIANKAIKAQIKAICDNESYVFNLVVNVKNSAPSVTIKQDKFNVFYTDSFSTMTVTVKNEIIEKMWLDSSNPNFTGTDNLDGTLTIKFSSPDSKPKTSAKLYIKLAGYKYPLEKAVTISTVTTKPKLVITPATSTIYAAEPGKQTEFAIYDMTNNEYITAVDIMSTSTWIEGFTDIEGTDNIALKLKGTTGGKAVLTINNIDVQDNNKIIKWTSPINVNYTVNAKTSVPTIKFASTTLTLNKIFNNVVAKTKYTLDQSNVKLTDIEGVTFTSVPKGVDKDTASTWITWKLAKDKNELEVALTDAGKEYAAYGTYVLSSRFKFDTNHTRDVTLKVVVNQTKPTAKLTKSTMTENVKFNVGDSTKVTFSNYNEEMGTIALSRYEIDDNFKLSYDSKNSVLSVTLNDDSYSGTKTSYTGKVYFKVNDEELSPVTLTVKTTSIVPTVTASTVTLNKRLSETGTSTLKLSTKGYSLEGFKNLDNDNVRIIFNKDKSTLSVELKDDAKTKAAQTFSISLIPQIRMGGSEKVIDGKIMTLKVSMIDKVASATVSASGKIVTISRNAGITYTVTKLNNAVGEIESATLDGADKDLFTLIETGLNSKGQHTFMLILKNESKVSTKIKYKIRLRIKLKDSEDILFTPTLDVNPTQSSLKLTATPTSQTYFQSQDRSREVVYTVKLTGPTDAEIGSWKTGDVSLFQKALVNDANIEITRSGDNDRKTLLVKVCLKDTSKLIPGKSYTLPIEITPEGNASNVTSTKIKLNLKVQK